MQPVLSDSQRERKQAVKGRASDLIAPWERQNFSGSALTLRGFAAFWNIQERTVQRHAKAGKIPGVFQSGQRLKIRRCRASYEYGQLLWRKLRGQSLFKELASFAKKPAVRAIYATVELDAAKTGCKPGDMDFNQYLAGLDVGPLDLMSGEERFVFEKSPQHFQILAEAVRLLNCGELPTHEKIAQKLQISRRTFIRRFPEMTRARIKKAAMMVFGGSMPEGESPPEGVPYQTWGGRRPGR